jgi:hypothetical protein
MRADIHGGPEQKLQSEAGYIDARPQTDSSANPLATHGRTIHSGQKNGLLGNGRYWRKADIRQNGDVG